jgi:hypothetical protein
VLLVKALRFLRDHVDEHFSDTDCFGRANRTQHGIGKQMSAETFALLASIIKTRAWVADPRDPQPRRFALRQ